MSYNGSGVWTANSVGLPVVTGTTISSTMFNAFTADVATGFSTAVCKDGQQTCTQRVPFAQGVSVFGVNLDGSAGSGQVGFIASGAGAVARTLQSKGRDVVSVKDFGAVGDGVTDDYDAIAAGIAALAARGGGKLFFPLGQYLTNTQIDIEDDGIELCGDASGYSYAVPSGYQTAAIIAGDTMTNVINLIASEGVTYSNYCTIRNLWIVGDAKADNGINVAGANLISNVTVSGCLDAGIRLGDFTNSTQLEYVSCVGNTGGDGYGLFVTGANTTIYSVRCSNFRSNTIGLRIQGGLGAQFEQVVSESNVHEGLYIYSPNGTAIGRMTFQHLWLEFNNAGTSNYQAVITEQTLSLTTGPSYIVFNQLDGTASGSVKAFFIESARYLQFHQCKFSGGAGTITLDTNCSMCVFYDKNGGSISDSGNRNWEWMTEASNTKGQTITGSYTELGRTYALGYWQTRTFSAGDYTASGSMTWTLVSGDVTYERWIMVGKTMTFAFRYDTTTVGGVADIQLKAAIPGGFVAAADTATLVRVSDNGAEKTGIATVTSAGTVVNFQLNYYSATNWALATNATAIIGEITFEVQ